MKQIRSVAVYAQHTLESVRGSTLDEETIAVFSGVGGFMLAAAAGPAPSGTQPRSGGMATVLSNFQWLPVLL